MDVKENIFFLAGFPRSGTTWFANILNAHSKIIYRHEIIGRNYYIFEDKLFDALKHNNGLKDDEFLELVANIAEARVDTDKPPFFSKSSGLLKYKDLHYYAWLATKALPVLSPAYKALYSVKKTDDFYFFIKETRSSVNMDSIIAGLRPVATLFLVRQPLGVIASYIKGVRKGAMDKIEHGQKQVWYGYNEDALYIKEMELTVEQVVSMGDIEFLALRWRIYHDDLLRYSKQFTNVRFFSYDDFVETPTDCVKGLFSYLKLDYDRTVSDFIEESSGKGNSSVATAKRDASDEYFSVYRQASFDPQSWSKVLSQDEVKQVEKHTASTYEVIRALI